MGIGNRIKSERIRLGHSQTAFAQIGGASKNSQIAWEKDVAHPNATVLAAWAEAGADVLYILTGQRSQAVPAQALLEPRQRALLDHWEHTSEEGKKIIEAAAFAAAQPAAKRGSKAA